MCGIAGIVAANAPRYRGRVDAMVAALSHRGPDGSGTHYFQDCALGHTRLSIVDLEGGSQPMMSPDGKLGIVFNGEIYGYKELRAAQDYPYQTESDTEVIIALYERYGSKLLDHLPGMFAFALWDEREKTLFCARDRFGEKPFYYAMGPQGEFVFASEIKAILASGLVETELNHDALAHYLQKLYVHSSQSIYKGIQCLPPAHCLVYRNGRVEVSRYWDLPPTQGEISVSNAVEEFSSLLDRAIAKQLVADVPVGVFLSGGLDSTTVISIASRYAPNITTFSFGFDEGKSELPYAREVAHAYHTNHIELHDKHSKLDELLFEMQNVYDEPFADSSNIPTYLISKLAREHIKVVLGGDGGDELLAGYTYWYRSLFDMQKEMTRQMERPLLTRELFFLSYRMMKRFRIPVHKSQRAAAEGVRLAKNLTSIAEVHRAQNEYFNAHQLLEFGVRPWTPAAVETNSRDIDDALRMDLQDYMPGDILVKTDRASMAHGLELRAPFLDVPFAEFCISLPFRMKIDNSTDKQIMREAFSERWPEKIRTRPKQGFGAPVNHWLKRRELQALKREFLEDPQKRLFSILDSRAVGKYIEEDTDRTWLLLVLSMWLETHSRVTIEP